MQSRRESIKNMLERTGFVNVRELVSKFEVSSETIRRDLEAMEKNGILKRVHGGAVKIRQESSETVYQTRQACHILEKQAIAKVAAAMIHDGDTVIITPGTTALEVAKLLKNRSRLNVITNSLPISMELANCPGIGIVLLGGIVRGEDFSTTGVIAIENLSVFNANKLIIGIGGITPYHGITDYRMDESALLRTYINRVSCVIGIADHSKFGVVSVYNIRPANRLDHLITDSGTPEEIRQQYREMGIQVHIAEM